MIVAALVLPDISGHDRGIDHAQSLDAAQPQTLSTTASGD